MRNYRFRFPSFTNLSHNEEFCLVKYFQWSGISTHLQYPNRAIILPSIPRSTHHPTNPSLPPSSLSLISPRGDFIVVSSHNTRTVTTPADAFPALRSTSGYGTCRGGFHKTSRQNDRRAPQPAASDTTCINARTFMEEHDRAASEQRRRMVLLRWLFPYLISIVLSLSSLHIYGQYVCYLVA